MSAAGIILLILIILVLFYFYSIMPRMFHRPKNTALDHTRLFAHRGLFNNDSAAPENSLPAFQKAIDHGFGIEFDLHLTKDGIPVVFHDFALQRMCGVSGCVEDYTLEELSQFHLAHSQETIPTLRQVLDLIHGQVPLIIEYKTETRDVRVCEVSDRMLREYQGSYCIESFNPLALWWYRRHHKDICRGQLSDAFLHYPQYRRGIRAAGSFVLQYLMLDFLSRPDFIAYNCLYEKNTSLRLYRNLYRGRAAAWTVKSGTQLQKIRPYFDDYIFDSFVPEDKDIAE